MKRFPTSFTDSDRAPCRLDPSRILLEFKKAIDAESVSKLLGRFQLEVESHSKSKENLPWMVVNHTDRRYWVKSKNNRAITGRKYADVERALKARIAWIGPVYQQGDKKDPATYFCPIPNVVLVRRTSVTNINSFAKKHGLVQEKAKSKYLSNWYCLRVADVKKKNAFELRDQLGQSGTEVLFESMPLMKPIAAIPNDTFWAEQWDMAQINAPNGWDIATGSNTVVICVLDEGCDLTHPDLQYSEPGINLGTMLPPGSPTGSHGTACAGIAAGRINNNAGVAGVAGDCLVMPVAFQTWSDVEVANGINYASTNGASVISMSFGWNPWNPMIIDPEIQNAFDNDVVMCVATHNHNGAITYPATNPLVMAVGGSSTDDNRKTFGSPDGECWGANFGDVFYNGVLTGVSVVAPCVQCPTTDIQGAPGYSNNGTIPDPWACVSYPPQVASGDYIMMFDGTSAATPHVAGLAGLIKSRYPVLSNVQIRRAIELSAARVGGLAYAVQAGFPNGPRNEEMGYGRIDVAAALEEAREMVACKDKKMIANLELLEVAKAKANHLVGSGQCPDFQFFLHDDKHEKKCKPIKVPELRPCFYLHWGDSSQDNIETSDFEVLILSVCNPYANVAFKDLRITDIEVVHTDGSKAELLPAGTSSALVVPSKLLSVCELAPCSCCHLELVLRTCGAKDGKYYVVLDYCVEEICLVPTEKERDRGKVKFGIELIKS